MRSVGEKWYNLGIELLDPDDVEELDRIEAKHPSDLKKCCTKMFQFWLRKHPTASWNQLIIALRQQQPLIGLNVLAWEIEQMLLKSDPILKPEPILKLEPTGQLFIISLIIAISH